MKIVGLIAEYNPLHKGHQYQLKQIRRSSQCDVLVVVMSGNVVQRGQFAVLDKWQRAQIAIDSGADFVFELPLLASLQSADYFAKVGIELLALLNCSEVYFGSEQADIQTLTQFVETVEAHRSALDIEVKAALKTGLSYAASYQQAIVSVLGEFDFDSSLPNHQLGIQYIKANRQLKHPMILQTIKRIKNEDGLYSATSVREKITQGQLQSAEVPLFTWQAIQANAPVLMNDYWPLLKYQLTTHNAESLKHIFGIKEGFEVAILNQLRWAMSWDDFVNRLTSKRWTAASVNRILIAVLGNITDQQWQDYKTNYAKQPVIRLLAYREGHSHYLKDLRHQSVEIIANWKKITLIVIIYNGVSIKYIS
ncbi:nucleotidyltransferase family protein [Globicatella sp. PHS-GS-PNBC-21-1553]|uniref:tRNA(Met) cytidine acetate ligase n=1 Tax=Globicatella sp. PHS-GS-PNBC-21-1553 TaxID=2885764 RepID=UPI00298ED278|nr:nucleotidyltransferase family protein [Globicatella sp. PHS-GS-PNBC-21-1553]WPC07906.1 nucleotidyltransferase family protein [Globicatella sp. PHS-GS-PNBC-21-1553]